MFNINEIFCNKCKTYHTTKDKINLERKCGKQLWIITKDIQSRMRPFLWEMMIEKKSKKS